MTRATFIVAIALAAVIGAAVAYLYLPRRITVSDNFGSMV